MEYKEVELDQYKKAVNNLAALKSSLVFNNSSPEHAAIVLSTMLKYSQNEFRVYDNDLSGDISELNPDFFSNLSLFVEANKVVKIVIDSLETSANTTAYTTLLSYKKMFPETVLISVANDEFKESIFEIYNKKINFALGDKSFFRIEDSNSQGSQRKAICCFNNPSVTQKLAQVFDRAFSSCQSI